MGLLDALETQYGLPAGYLARVASIESNGDPGAVNPRSGARGPFQFMPATASQYALTDPHDFNSSADAAARLARDNAGVLRSRLGRDPSGGELYLAHQQGAGGASKLLLNPGADAAGLIGQRALAANGGTVGMTGADFASKWTGRFDGNAPTSSAAPSPTPARPSAQEPRPMAGLLNTPTDEDTGFNAILNNPRFLAGLTMLANSTSGGSFMQGVPEIFAASQKRDELRAQQRALSTALTSAGVSPEQAAIYARSPEAAKLAMDQIRQGRQDQAGAEFTSTLGRLLGPQADTAPTPMSAPPAPRSPFPAPTAPMLSPPVAGAMAFAGPDGMPSADSGRVTGGFLPASGTSPAVLPQNESAANSGASGGPSVARPATASPQERLSQGIPALMKAAANPNLPEASRQMANTLLSKTLENNAPTSDMKEYATYVRQEAAAGRVPEDFTPWMRANRKSGATMIDMSQKADGEFEKKLADKAASRWAAYMDQGDAAQSRLADIGQMREISNRAGSQGAAVNAKTLFGPYLEAIGINVDGLADAQTYDSMVKRLAPSLRQPGSGSQSDADLKGFVASIGPLSNHPEARTMILDTLEAGSRNDLARASIATDLANRVIDRKEAENKIRALPDPLTAFREFKKANPELYGRAVLEGHRKPQPSQPSTQAGGQQQASAPAVSVASPDEARKLAPGTRFTIPDGREFTR